MNRALFLSIWTVQTVWSLIKQWSSSSILKEPAICLGTTPFAIPPAICRLICEWSIWYSNFRISMVMLKRAKGVWIFEPQHKRKMYLPRCAPNENSCQPVHPCSLISVSIKKLCILVYPDCAQWRFWSHCKDARCFLWVPTIYVFMEN